MGNSSNSKIRQRADSMTIRYKEVKPAKEVGETFSKSKSMVELGAKQRAKSTGSIRDKPKLTPRDSTKTTSSNGITRTKSVRRDVSHPISQQSREIIVQCFENPHSEFGNKVLQRIFEKRADFQNYVYALGKERSSQMSVRLKDLIEDVVAKIYDPDYISAISRTYGEEHVDLKQFGWKPDFWVAIADAITVEGVILDMANHQNIGKLDPKKWFWTMLFTVCFFHPYYLGCSKGVRVRPADLYCEIQLLFRAASQGQDTVPFSFAMFCKVVALDLLYNFAEHVEIKSAFFSKNPADTVAAWSSLVTLMFSSVRDGYYQALRKHRMSSRKILRRQATVESQPGIPEEPPSCSQNYKQTTPPQGLTPSSSVMETSGSTSSQLLTGTTNSSRRTSSQSCDSETSTTITKSKSTFSSDASLPANIMAPVVKEMPPPPINCPVLVTSRSSRPIFE